jgi:hypothetical protein
MYELLDPLDGGERLALLIMFMLVSAGILIPIVIVACCQWRAVREREAATAVVHDMLARGMTTDEIVRVLSAAGISKKSRRDASQLTADAFASAGRSPYRAHAREA